MAGTFKRTTTLNKILALKKRLRIVQGGSSAGKTIAILSILIDMATSYPNLTISVVSESTPHLRLGAIKDFLNIMRAHNYYKEREWNRTIFTYHFSNGSTIEFFSADSAGKVHGPRRDILFINECNNVAFEIFRQLSLRTSKVIYLDFNPVTEFYVHDKLISREDSDFVSVTYRDNEALAPAIVQELESYKDDENFWRVYGLGQVGKLEGLIIPDFEIIKEIPERALKERYGLDFGFTNDPSAISGIYRFDGGFIIDEILCEKGQDNRMLANAIRSDEGLGAVNERNEYVGTVSTLTVADQAEPKSIHEIKGYGVPIIGGIKGDDSVRLGLQVVNRFKLSVTERSTKTIKALRNYQWKTDKDGNSLNVPEHKWSHIPDSIRYPIVDLVGLPAAKAVDIGISDTDYSDDLLDDYERNNTMLDGI